MLRQRHWGLLQTHGVIFKLDSGIFHVCPNPLLLHHNSKTTGPFFESNNLHPPPRGRGRILRHCCGYSTIRPPQQPPPTLPGPLCASPASGFTPKACSQVENGSYIPADTAHPRPETARETLAPREDAQPRRLLFLPAFWGILGASRRSSSSVHLRRYPREEKRC